MYCEMNIVVLDHLPKEQSDKIIDMMHEAAGKFIAITEGDESCPREVDFDDIITEADFEALAGDHVYIVSDGTNAVLEDLAMEVKPGYFAGEVSYVI